MGFEVGGIFGLIILVADIWAIVSTFQSQASTGKKVFWIVLVWFPVFTETVMAAEEAPDTV